MYKEAMEANTIFVAWVQQCHFKGLTCVQARFGVNPVMELAKISEVVLALTQMGTIGLATGRHIMAGIATAQR